MRGRRVVGWAIGCVLFGCQPIYLTRAGPRPSTPPSRQTAPKRAPRESDDHRAATRPAPRPVYLRLDLGDRRVYVIPAGERAVETAVLDSYPVAIGKPGYDTPVGRFVVTEKIVDPEFTLYDDWEAPTAVVRRFEPGPLNPLGVRWIGFTSVDGLGIGFHGTPRPELLGQAVSHGCVRMHNADVIRLYDQVAIGTTVLVEP